MTSSVSPKGGNTLIHQDVPRWNAASVLAHLPPAILGLWLLVRAILWLASGHIATGVVYTVLASACCLSVYAFLAPRRYQLLDDRLRIVYLRPFAMNLPFSRVEGVRPHTLWGLEYLVSYMNCTSSECIELLGPASSTFISPADRDLFMEKLNEALERNRSRRHA